VMFAAGAAPTDTVASRAATAVAVSAPMSVEYRPLMAPHRIASPRDDNSRACRGRTDPNANAHVQNLKVPAMDDKNYFGG